VKYPHPIFEKVLAPTYGTVIYQEQVLDIMRGLGLDIGTINVLFKIVKDSGSGAMERNLKRLTEIKDQFFAACRKNNVQDPEHSWEWLTGMAAYGFNHAHATGYGIRSYRAAYLKAHYPLEYMAAVLEGNAGDKKKEVIYAREARRIGIRLLPAHVNSSGMVWTLDPRTKGIRRGLQSVMGIGAAVAAEVVKHAPYASVEDLCRRAGRPVSGQADYLADGTLRGSISALHKAGALSGLES
jgi:DNA polymerase-3 subunit alpha